MVKIEKNTLEYLGYDYQLRLISHILSDAKFANNIIDIIDPNYFMKGELRIILATIKEAKDKDDSIIDMSSLQIRLMENVSTEMSRRIMLSQLEQIKAADASDVEYIQGVAMRFCKQQELKKAIKKIDQIIDNGDQLEECEGILRKALDHGDSNDEDISVFNNIEKVLEPNFRKPIRTGINGLDSIMNGGLGRGELGVILAPTGTGKTTMITKLANTAFLDGKKVIQIFFEDIPEEVQRKHFSCFTGVPIVELSIQKNKVIDIISKIDIDQSNLKLLSLPAHGTTVPIIKKYIRKLISKGFKPDIILLDYIDVVEPSRHYTDSNFGEGTVMREFECMLTELDVAGWLATQGNRSSIGAEIVHTNQMSGSIKKAMIGHFILSIAKTLTQKENNTATIAILKSRFGSDGMILENIIFNNGTLQIDMASTETPKTNNQFNIDRDKENIDKVKQLLEARKERETHNNSQTQLTN